jgi:hypothetical protein
MEPGMNWDALLNPGSLGVMVPMLAVVYFAAVYFIVAAIIKHRERMAMIERGMDPDALQKRS